MGSKMDKKMGRPKLTVFPKSKFTWYLTDEAKQKFNEIYALRVMTSSKDTRSDLLCQAIDLLYEKEMGNFNKKD